MKQIHTPTPEQERDAEIRRLRQQLRTLTEEAAHNESILKRFHERELSLLAADTLPQLLEILTTGMRHSFDLPCITLALHDPDHELRHLLLHSDRTAEDYADIWFVDQLEELNPLCARLRKPWLGPYLHDEHRSLFPATNGLQSIALLPMWRRTQRIGSIHLGSRDPKRFTRHHASDFLNRLATIGAICLENTTNREHLVISGLTDALTGLHNRRYLERRLGEEISRARRYHQPLSCLFLDADHFKRVNDQHGHAAGDSVLREISLRVRECLRASDVATRFGGEEFTLLLPQTDIDEACHLAERIRIAIGSRPIPTPAGAELNITLSIGVSQLPQSEPEDPAAAGRRLLEQADQALYQAKKQGRDRVVRYGER